MEQINRGNPDFFPLFLPFFKKKVKLFNLDDFYGMAHPVRRQIDPPAVARRFHFFFDHLFTVYLKFHPGSGSQFRIFIVSVVHTDSCFQKGV